MPDKGKCEVVGSRIPRSMTFNNRLKQTLDLNFQSS